MCASHHLQAVSGGRRPSIKADVWGALFQEGLPLTIPAINMSERRADHALSVGAESACADPFGRCISKGHRDANGTWHVRPKVRDEVGVRFFYSLSSAPLLPRTRVRNLCLSARLGWEKKEPAGAFRKKSRFSLLSVFLSSSYMLPLFPFNSLLLNQRRKCISFMATGVCLFSNILSVWL